MSQSGKTGRKPGKKYVMISVVAEQLAIHPQTIRLYEREGLISPTRSAGNTRLYDEEAIRRLETILTLTRDMGINLAGVEVILGLKDRIEELRAEVERLREDLRQFTNDERAGVDRRFALVQIKSGLPVKR